MRTDRLAPERVLDFVATFSDESGFPPTLREIGEHFAIRSTNGVRYWTDMLIERGWCKRAVMVSRGLSVTPAGRERLETWRRT